MSIQELGEESISRLFEEIGGPVPEECGEGLSQFNLSFLDSQRSSGSDLDVCTKGTGPSGCSDSTFINEIKRASLRPTLVRSVIRCADYAECLQVAGDIRATVAGGGNSGSSRFVAVVPHKHSLPHVHVWHDCTYRREDGGKGYCSCRVLKPYRAASTPIESNWKPYLATRKTVPRFRPLRGISTFEAAKEGNGYYSSLLKYINWYMCFTFY